MHIQGARLEAQQLGLELGPIGDVSATGGGFTDLPHNLNSNPLLLEKKKKVNPLLLF